MKDKNFYSEIGKKGAIVNQAKRINEYNGIQIIASNVGKRLKLEKEKLLVLQDKGIIVVKSVRINIKVK